eukprot:2351644-Amphidinium_carterae.1
MTRGLCHFSELTLELLPSLPSQFSSIFCTHWKWLESTGLQVRDIFSSAASNGDVAEGRSNK